MSESATTTAVLGYFVEWAASRLGRETVDADAPLTQLGLDSVHAAELMTILEDRYQTEIAAEDIFDGLTLADVARRVNAQQVGAPRG
ncbi:acyl carrier protein [Nocardia sp. NPDC058058]|uniref:acyl carrier protein n=1 Tax=Nocardia sp. NPDC058058 TaxID=3346317 RepID=UPI0036D9900D